MARKLVVEIVGDASQLERTYKGAAAGTKAFSREVESAGRGALVATVGFRGLGRAIAYAGGSFLAFESVGAFLRSSIDAAQEAQVGQRALAAQMRASGEAFKENQARIDQAEGSLARYGFTSEDSAKALTVLDRATGSITRSMGLQLFVANLARAKNLDLASAANIVAKVFGGQETALRRAVPGLEKHAHGLELIAEAEQKVSGQARAATTPSERFRATLHDTEVIVGTALLPVFNKYLGQLSVWLDKMNRSGKLQKDVNETVKAAVPLFNAVGQAAGLAAKAVGKYGDALSGLRHTSSSGNPALRGIADVARVLIDPGYGISKVIQTLKGPGASHGAESSSALDAMLKPAGDGVLGLGVPAGYSPTSAVAAAVAPRAGASAGQRNTWFDQMISRSLDRVQDIPTLRGQISRLRQIADLVTQRIAATKDITRKLTLGDTLVGITRQMKTDQQQISQNMKAARDAAKQHALDAAQVVVDRAALTASLTDDLAALRHQLQVMKQEGATADEIVNQEKAIKDKEAEIAQAQKDRVAAVRQQKIDAAALAVQRAGLTDSLTDDLAALRNQLAAMKKNHAAATDIVTQLQAIKDKQKEIAQQAQAAADQAKQALLHTGDVAIARAALTDTLKDDLAAHEKRLSLLKRTHADEVDILDEMKTILDLKKQQAGTAADWTKFTTVSTKAFEKTAGLTGLSVTQTRALRTGLAMMGPGGTMPGTASLAFAGQNAPLHVIRMIRQAVGASTLIPSRAGDLDRSIAAAGITINGGVHLHGVQDVPAFENALTKRGKQRAHRRRGS
jgi:hypothetical protein